MGTWPRLKKITRKLASRRPRAKERKRDMATSSEQASIAMSPPDSIEVLPEPMAIVCSCPLKLLGQFVTELRVGCFALVAFRLLRLMYYYGSNCWKHPNMCHCMSLEFALP